MYKYLIYIGGELEYFFQTFLPLLYENKIKEYI